MRQVVTGTVRFISPLVGGDFGSKGTPFVEPIVALLAARTNQHQPVRLVLTRMEELVAMEARPLQDIHLKLGARSDGTLVALEGDVLSDVGGVDDGGAARPPVLVEPYRIPNVRVSGVSVYTNTSPSGHVRAPGGPQNAFAIESAMFSLARKLGMARNNLRARLKQFGLEGPADTDP